MAHVTKNDQQPDQSQSGASEQSAKAGVVKRVSITNNKKARKKRRTKSWWGKPKPPKRFDAFAVKQTAVTPEGKTFVYVKAVAPETGIHSRAWAEAIEPQTGFLSLPIELRHRIYHDLLADAVIESPRKIGARYTAANKDTIKTYNVLTQLSRQIYVDVVGGGLLYHFASFGFSSADTMSNYLPSINPAHMNILSKVSLGINLTETAPKFRSLVYATLATLPNLRELKICVGVNSTLCSLRKTYQTTLGPLQQYELAAWVTIGLLENVAKWRVVKGLEVFEMKFEGRWNDLYMFSQIPVFYAADWRLVMLERKIREVVTRKREA